MKDTPLEWRWQTAVKLWLCDELICSITHLAVSLCSCSKTGLLVLTPRIQFLGKHKALIGALPRSSCLGLCPFLSLKAQDFTGQRTWPVPRSPEVSPSPSLPVSIMLLQTPQHLFEDRIYCLSKYQQKYHTEWSPWQMALQWRQDTCATLDISYDMLCIYP